MKARVLLVAETLENRVAKASLELAGFARSLDAGAGANAMFVVAGSAVEPAATALAEDTGLPVAALEGPALAWPNPELLADLVCDMASGNGAEMICFLHTACGCHGAARVAARLHAPCISAVDGFQENGETFFFQRSICNGRLKMKVAPRTGPLVVTLLPGAFTPAGPGAGDGPPPAVILQTVTARSETFRPLGITRESSGDAALEHAEIIVAVGRGLGNPENLETVNRLARLLPNAAVGASRPLCDLKWLPYSRQVGATGRTVSPRLYIACGISGAQQHVQGMKDSQWIVAINTDPHAAIFSVAHFGVVEDMMTFLPLLAEAYEEMKKA